MNLTNIDIWLFVAIGVLLILRTSRAWVFHSIARAQNGLQDNPSDGATSMPSVSIIITAHDQAGELRRNLPLLLAQKYDGRFEVIVVNDASTDDTEDVLKLTKQEHPNFYYTFMPDSARYVSHKKLAITIGAKAAKGEWLMLTEADCAPRSENWLATMCSNCQSGIDIVCGPTVYRTEEKRRFSSHIAFERLFALVKQARRFLSGSKVYRASGCNLLVRTSAFNANKGFMHNLQLKRGEDDLLVNELAAKGNHVLELRPEAIVEQDEPIVYKIWKTDRVFYIETQRHFTRSARRADNWLQAFHSAVLLLFVLTAIAGTAWTVVQQSWFFLPVYPLALLLAWTVNGLSLRSSARAMGITQPFGLLLPYYELWHIADEVKFRIQHKARHKDEFRRN